MNIPSSVNTREPPQWPKQRPCRALWLSAPWDLRMGTSVCKPVLSLWFKAAAEPLQRRCEGLAATAAVINAAATSDPEVPKALHEVTGSLPLPRKIPSGFYSRLGKMAQSQSSSQVFSQGPSWESSKSWSHLLSGCVGLCLYTTERDLKKCSLDMA